MPAVARLSALVALHDIGTFAFAFPAKVRDQLPAIFATAAVAVPGRRAPGSSPGW